VENNVHNNVYIKVLIESDVGQIPTHGENIKKWTWILVGTSVTNVRITFGILFIKKLKSNVNFGIKAQN
jgi:hypothetical protein